MPYPVIQHSYASPSTVAWVIRQKYELIDETPIQVLGEPGRNTTDSYMWVYCSIKIVSSQFECSIISLEEAEHFLGSS